MRLLFIIACASFIHTQIDSFSLLPKELHIKIIEKLNENNLKEISRVNKTFNQVSKETRLYAQWFQRNMHEKLFNVPSFSIDSFKSHHHDSLFSFTTEQINCDEDNIVFFLKFNALFSKLDTPEFALVLDFHIKDSGIFFRDDKLYKILRRVAHNQYTKYILNFTGNISETLIVRLIDSCLLQGNKKAPFAIEIIGIKGCNRQFLENTSVKKLLALPQFKKLIVHFHENNLPENSEKITFVSLPISDHSPGPSQILQRDKKYKNISISQATVILCFLALVVEKGRLIKNRLYECMKKTTAIITDRV